MIGSHRFPAFRPDPKRLELRYLLYLFRTEFGRRLLERVSPGGAGRNRTLSGSAFLNQEIPLPPVLEQQRLVARIEELAVQISEARTLRQQAEKQAKAIWAQSAADLLCWRT
jgi:type I restriction enzyme S subunit